VTLISRIPNIQLFCFDGVNHYFNNGSKTRERSSTRHEKLRQKTISESAKQQKQFTSINHRSSSFVWAPWGAKIIAQNTKREAQELNK
jgi:hypothetical protein